MRILATNGLTLPSVVLKVCAKDCSQDCVEYKTPVEMCYNPLTLFPGDPQWGPYDIKDTIDKGGVKRTFYLSQNGSCLGEAESAVVPLGVKIGPMGQPRSCGIFRVE